MPSKRLELSENEQLIHIKGLLKQMKCTYADFTLSNGKSYIYNSKGQLSQVADDAEKF